MSPHDNFRHIVDRQGRLITCEQGNRRVTRTEHDGTITVLADSYGGRRLNSPNDVVVRGDGNHLFITAGRSVYTLRVTFNGARYS